MKNPFGMFDFLWTQDDPKNKFAWTVWSLYCLCVIFLIAVHEPWRDELQFWLIARDLDYPGMIYQMRHEGHFVFWIFLLSPFAKLGFPVISMNLLSGALMMFAGWLFLFRSPFPKWFKIFFLFSYPILYYFSAVSRCYALIVPILWLLALYYPERRQRRLLYALLIVALVHTHAYMEGLAGILFLFFFYDAVIADWRKQTARQRLSGVLIALLVFLGVLSALCQVMPSFGNTPAAEFHPIDKHHLSDFWRSFGLYLFPPQILSGEFRMFWIEWYRGLVLIALLVIGWRSPRLLIISLISIGWMLCFDLYLYPATLQRTFLPEVVIVFVWWLWCVTPGEEKRLRPNLLLFLLILPWYFHHKNTWKDITGLYSPLGDCGHFIAQKTDLRMPFLVSGQNYAGAISAYAVAAKFYDYDMKPISFFVHQNESKTDSVAPENALKFFETPTLYLILRDHETPPEGNFRVRKIYEAPRQAVWRDEVFDIYEISRLKQ